ncbi:hypothetical protein D3C87_1370980 [compost metagenome]|uniref:hypothetical protein n=1 Tax=Achromobacter sp. Root83 TaxID=1736602 RepID=UPI00070F0456|nr:hypothetical protein [Achromobacter sp. Root83]KRC76375.1 hypothetical protein ASE30_07135 [Achromobacter sp. Root83]
MTYKAQCEDWGNAIREQADRFYDHQINETRELIQKANDEGKDPSKIELADGIATINYERLLQDTIDAKQLAYSDAEAKAAQCDANAVPDWLSDVQKTTDFAMTVALLPYVALTKSYAAAKIDLGQVYKGRTFGGDDALIPKAREEAFNALGIGGDVAKVLRDPVNEVRNTVNDAVEAMKKALPQLPKINWPKW